MKKLTKKVVTYVLVMFSMLSVCVQNVQAGELNSNFKVKFIVTDSTGEFTGNSVTIHFEDVTGSVSEDLTITKDSSWGSKTGIVPEISLPAPTTYNMTVVGIDEGFKLMDIVEGTELNSSFAATNNGETTFYCEFIKDTGDIATNGSTEGAQSRAENFTVTNAEAEKVYNEFLDTVSFIKDDPTWADFLDAWGYNINVEGFGAMYSTCVNKGDRTEEDLYAEYKEMSNYDKFLWNATYLYIADFVNKGHGADISTYDALLKKNPNVIQLMTISQRNKCDEVVAAYEKLLQWQADYIAANGSPFNFINNRSYLQEMGVGEVPESKADELYEKEKAEAEREIKKAAEEEERGVWDDTLEVLSSNMITLLIIIILLGALGVVIYIKKKNNFSDEIHEKI